MKIRTPCCLQHVHIYIYKHKASHVHVLQVTGLHKSTKILKSLFSFNKVAKKSLEVGSTLCV